LSRRGKLRAVSEGAGEHDTCDAPSSGRPAHLR
jgi:hypothetical protein